jgi:predicted  nucleic acid-binding Zn-ribbon protein
MREQIVVLDELQRIDMELSELEVSLKEYPEKISAFEQELETSRNTITDLNTQNEQHKESKSKLEQEIANNEEMIKKSEEKLFEIKTHKEYAALQKEISDTKRMNSDLEESLIDDMEKIEQIESKVSEIQEELTVKEEEYREKIDGFKEKLEEVNKLYGPKVAEKDTVSSKINPEILPIYEKIKKRDGTVLALAKNEVCTACHMNIPPQMFNEVLTLSKIIQCPSCKKILYCEEDIESEAKTG